jgi:hypothetical protein
MLKELKGLEDTGTFQMVPRPANRNIIKSKWVYRVKRTSAGAPIFKSRLVARGFSQRPGVDYNDTWAPTAKQTTARVLLHMAAHLDLELHAMDVDQAFLHGELEETIFMEPPREVTGDSWDKVWQLKRPLYGLKQSPRQWHAKLQKALQDMGLHPSLSDPSLFLGTLQSHWILVYVDDLLLLSPDTSALEQLKDQLKAAFPMKDLGPVTSYLGMEVKRDREKKTIQIQQGAYITKVLDRFKDCPIKDFSTPLAVNHGLDPPTPDEPSCPDQERYAELVGSMMYLMICTRPDLAHPLSVLGSFVAPGRHKERHWKAALRVLGYVRQTASLWLTLGGSQAALTGYTDASWADIPESRKSSQGYSCTLGSGAISWKGTKSPAVALSTCEAELYGCTAAAQELMWLTRLLKELGIDPPDPPILWCDNQSTIALAKDAVISGRSKHIEARYYFIRELTQAKRLSIQHIAGVENPADLFTKALLRERHETLVPMLGLYS